MDTAKKTVSQNEGTQGQPLKEKVMELNLSMDALTENSAKIAAIDTQLAAASGNEASVKKALVEKVALAHHEAVDSIVEKVIASLSKQPDEIIVGLTYRLSEALDTTFAPKVDAYITEQVKSTVSASQEQIEGLKAQRKELITIDQALRTVLRSYGFKDEVDATPEPKRAGGGRRAESTGGTVKSGKNKEGYRYQLDGKDRPNSTNTFSSLAYFSTKGVPKALNEAEKADARWGVKQLRDFLVEKGIKFGEADTWELELPNGRKIGARRLTAEEQKEMDSEEATTEAEAEVAVSA